MSIHVDEGKDGFVRTTTEFDVSVVWKGPLNRTIAITTGGSNCAFGFSEGEEYIVYSNSGSAGICGRTHNLAPGFYDVDYNDLEELGPGQAPTADATDPAPTAISEIPASGGGCGRAPSSGADVWWAALAVGAAWLGRRRIAP